MKFLGDYDLGSLDWSSKDLGAIETELSLISQSQCLIKTPSDTASLASRYVAECRNQTTTPHLRGKQEPSFSYLHKLSRDIRHVPGLGENNFYVM